jgi:two-component system, OmpR family, osmolarity sensor histidine kinase EnvZ
MRISLPRSSVVKRVLPRSLLARSLLIMLVPLVVVQAVALQIFYGSHLDIVSRRLSGGVAGEIATSIELLQMFPNPVDQNWILRNAWDQFEMEMTVDHEGVLQPAPPLGPFNVSGAALNAALQEKVQLPFTIDSQSDPLSVVIHVQLPDGVLVVHAPRKRLFAATFYVFVIWLVGSSLAMFGIAALFMRNQVRAIRRLAAAAEAFGMGRDAGPIKPAGATEVRQAAVAFNRMQDRISRFLQQRTEMLAGVSHDLRTPLTRLRLALAVMPATEELRQDVAEMTGDVEEMERMIAAYLAFARGEGVEQARPTNLGAVLEDVAAGARRAGALVALQVPESLVLSLRADAVKRAVTNLVDNARRHSRNVALAAMRGSDRFVQVTVDDDGPGIPYDLRESAFKPFESGRLGGIGLGLSIARDIVRAHGGDIVLEDSPMGGLRARIRLPV